GPPWRPLFLPLENDDLHHALHVVLTGERGGYYEDYQPPLPHLARSLTEGFAYQGQWSAYRGRARCEHTADPPRTLPLPGPAPGLSRPGEGRAERGASPHELRGLSPESRSGRQPRLR